MFKNLLLVLMVSTLAVSCGTSKKKGEGDGSAVKDTTQSLDNSISNKDINFDAKGSDSGNISGLKTVHFEYDDSKITPEAKSILEGNAKWIKENKNVTVQIEGHCDDRGSAEYNLSLGERRAKTVKSYMQQLGVGSNRMSVISYGKEKPIVPGDSEEARAQNRRGNFVPMPN